jgi:hypothetical protein
MVMNSATKRIVTDRSKRAGDDISIRGIAQAAVLR